MKKYVDTIINQTNYETNCHGLHANDSAETLAQYCFAKENIPFVGWKVREIPLIDNSEKYPVAIVLCINNEQEQKEISLNFTRNGKLFSVNPDELAEIELNTIAEAIIHPKAKYSIT